VQPFRTDLGIAERRLQREAVEERREEESHLARVAAGVEIPRFLSVPDG
jgi:hypothetical protein